MISLIISGGPHIRVGRGQIAVPRIRHVVRHKFGDEGNARAAIAQGAVADQMNYAEWRRREAGTAGGQLRRYKIGWLTAIGDLGRGILVVDGDDLSPVVHNS